MRRGLAAMAAVLIVAAAALVMVGCGEQGQAAPPRDFVAEWMTLMREQQGITDDSQDGAAKLAEAIEIFNEVLSRSMSYEPLSPGEPEGEYNFGFAEVLAPDATPESHAEGKRVLQELERSGFFAKLSEVMQYPGATRPLTEETLADSRFTDTQPVRSIARAQAYRIRLAAEAGRWDEVREVTEQTLALASIFMRRPTLVEHMLGSAVAVVVFEELASIIRGQIDDGTACRGLMDAVERLPAADPVPSLAGERLVVLEIAWNEAPARGDRRRASRDEEIEKINWMFDQVEAVAKEPVRAWIDAIVPMGVGLESVPERFAVMHGCMPATAKVMNTRDYVNPLRDGVRTLLAVELFRIEHGRLPAALDELVPAVLPKLPTDPFAVPPAPYRYNVLDKSEHGDDPRPYLLYSVGYDAVDNGGTQHPERNLIAIMRDRGDGSDLLINPRPAAASPPEEGR